MKVLPSHDERLIFEFTPHEKDLFLAALSFYPLMNPDYHQLSKDSNDPKILEGQKLLREAMEEQRRESKKKLTEFVEGIDWRVGEEQKFKLTLTPEQVDWLLRVLNDVRVGAWDIVGRPTQEQRDSFDLQSKNSHYYGVMELSGLFQSAFLHALEKKRESSS